MHKHTPKARNIAAFVVLLSLTVGPASSAENSAELTVDPSVIPQNLVEQALALRDRALKDNLSVDIVESVTTEVGPRRIGTEGDKRVILGVRFASWNHVRKIMFPSITLLQS